MTEKSERRWGLLRFTLLSLIALLAVSTIGGATYEATASARDRLMYPPPGKLIDIGGRKLHINCIGQGPPTVILDAGLGDSSVTGSLCSRRSPSSRRSALMIALAWDRATPTRLRVPLIGSSLI